MAAIPSCGLLTEAAVADSFCAECLLEGRVLLECTVDPATHPQKEVELVNCALTDACCCSDDEAVSIGRAIAFLIVHSCVLSMFPDLQKVASQSNLHEKAVPDSTFIEQPSCCAGHDQDAVV